MYHFTNTWICWHLIGFKPLHQVKPHRKLACVSYHLSYMSNNLYDLGGGILFQRKSKDLFTLFNITFNKNKLRFSSSTSNFVIKVCFLNCFQYNTDFSPMRWENKSRYSKYEVSSDLSAFGIHKEYRLWIWNLSKFRYFKWKFETTLLQINRED